MTAPPRSDRQLGVLAMSVAIVAFSMGSPFVRKAGAPGPVIAFWRMCGTAVIWQLLLARQGRRVTVRMIREIGFLGLVFGANLTSFFTAATKTRIANLEMISALGPLVVFPMAAVLYQERVRGGALLLGLPAFGGVALVLFGAPSSDVESSGVGIALGILTVLLWCTYLLLSRGVRGRYTTTEFMATISLVSIPMVLPFALTSATPITQVPAIGWFFIAVLSFSTGTGAHGLLQWTQQRLPVSTISMMQVAQPALAIVWAFFLLGEGIRPVQLVGVVVVLSSLAAFTYATTRPSEPVALPT